MTKYEARVEDGYEGCEVANWVADYDGNTKFAINSIHRSHNKVQGRQCFLI